MEELQSAKSRYSMLLLGRKNILMQTHKDIHTHTYLDDLKIPVACLYLKLVQGVASRGTGGLVRLECKDTFQVRHFHTFYILLLIVWPTHKKNNLKLKILEEIMDSKTIFFLGIKVCIQLELLLLYQESDSSEHKTGEKHRRYSDILTPY